MSFLLVVTCVPGHRVGAMREMLPPLAVEGSTVKTRYLLALMLERKKILIQIDAPEKDGQRLIIYKRRKTEEIFIVPDPGIELAEVAGIQAEVLALMPL